MTYDAMHFPTGLSLPSLLFMQQRSTPEGFTSLATLNLNKNNEMFMGSTKPVEEVSSHMIFHPIFYFYFTI